MMGPKPCRRPGFCLGGEYRQNTQSLKSGDAGRASNSSLCHREGSDTEGGLGGLEANWADLDNGLLLMHREEIINC